MINIRYYFNNHFYKKDSKTILDLYSSLPNTLKDLLSEKSLFDLIKGKPYK
jgi:hypothetical protein